MKTRYGFTLSELIVALAIIGIIAAITVPSLVQHYQKDLQVTMLKKAYKDLRDNLDKFQTENINGNLATSRLGGASHVTVNMTTTHNIGTSDVEGFFDDYYSVNQKCGHEATPCFADNYKSLDKEHNGHIVSNQTNYCVLLKDGSSMCITPASTTTKFRNGVLILSSKNPAVVYYDVNGPDKPNIGGRDLFVFNIYDDFSIDVVSPEQIAAGTAQEDRETLFEDECRSSRTGEGCFGKILNDNWKMNY